MIGRLKKAFGKSDLDHDGFLNIYEWNYFNKQLFGSEQSELYQEMCKFVDADPLFGLNYNQIIELFAKTLNNDNDSNINNNDNDFNDDNNNKKSKKKKRKKKKKSRKKKKKSKNKNKDNIHLPVNNNINTSSSLSGIMKYIINNIFYFVFF